MKEQHNLMAKDVGVQNMCMIASIIFLSGILIPQNDDIITLFTGLYIISILGWIVMSVLISIRSRNTYLK